MKGFELEASYDAGTAYIGASYTRLKAIYDGVYDPFFAGPPDRQCLSAVLSQWEREYFFIFVPPKEKYTLDGGVRFVDRKITLGARMTYVAPTVPITTPELLETYKQKSYHLYGLYMSAALNENLTARLNVDNLFDKAYVDAMGVPTLSGSGTHDDLSRCRQNSEGRFFIWDLARVFFAAARSLYGF